MGLKAVKSAIDFQQEHLKAIKREAVQPPVFFKLDYIIDNVIM